MVRTYLFADESGILDFRDHRVSKGVSRYFALGTATIEGDESVSSLETSLLQLRRDLAWQGDPYDAYFHATYDLQDVRDAVFDVINRHPVLFDVTLVDKAKIPPGLRRNDVAFYEHIWQLHLQQWLSWHMAENIELLVVAASFGRKREHNDFRAAIERAVAQHTSNRVPTHVTVVPAASEPGVQVADYGTWAVARAWESGDDRALNQVRTKVRSQYEPTSGFATTYHGRQAIPMKTIETPNMLTGSTEERASTGIKDSGARLDRRVQPGKSVSLTRSESRDLLGSDAWIRQSIVDAIPESTVDCQLGVLVAPRINAVALREPQEFILRNVGPTVEEPDV